MWQETRLAREIAPRELQDQHPRQIERVAHFLDGRCDHAEVFRDQWQTAERRLDYVEEGDPRPLDPLAVDGGRLAARNCPICLETPEVVDAHNVHLSERSL